MFNDAAAKTYTPNPAFAKHVVLAWEPAQYKVSWGEQEFDGPHMKIMGDAPYGCALAEFFTTHEPVVNRPHHWVKAAKIRAYQATKTTAFNTVVDGGVESTQTVEPGGWIVQNPGGEVYSMTADEFTERYVEAGS